MKKFFYFFLSFLGLFLILIFLFNFLSLKFLPELNKIFLFLFSFLISLLILFLFRKKPFEFSQFLLKFYISFFSAILFSYIFAFLFPKSNLILFNSLLLILFFAFLTFHFIIFYKRWSYGFIALLILIFLSFSITLIFSEMQKKLIKKYETKLKEIGYVSEIKDLFPKKYSKPLCENLIEKLEVFSKDKIGKWIAFYNKVVLPYQEENFFDFLKKGGNPENKILSDENIKNPLWEEFLNLSFQIREELEKCPHFQWFNPEEYKEKIINAPLPPLFPIVRFSRIQQTNSIILLAKGKEREGKECLKEIYDLKNKLKIKGLNLIATLIRLAIEKIYLTGEAYALAMGYTLSPEEIERVLEISNDDFSCLLSSFNLEIYSYIDIFKSLELKNLNGSDSYTRNQLIIKLPKFIKRAFFYGQTKNYLYNAYSIFEFLSNVKANENKFNWKDFKKIKQKNGSFFIHLNTAYGRNLVSVAQARILILSNEIFKYYEKNKTLPENFQFIENLNLIDPFTEKNFIYKKIDDKKFLIYSPGWDLKDDEGKDLYISGVINFPEEGKDIGFCFSL